MSPFPKGLVIATKGGLTRQGPDLWSPDGRPDYLAKEVEKSLRLLKTGAIDLWQLHRIDPKVPVEQSLEPIVKLKQQGKIRHIGLSEVKPKDIDRARQVVEIVSVQNLYNVGDRQHEDVLEYCERHNIAFIPWFPVAAGKLARPGGKDVHSPTLRGFWWAHLSFSPVTAIRSCRSSRAQARWNAKS